MNAFLEALVNGWWQGILLTFAVWLVMRDMPRISAATRLAIWHVTLAAVVLLPALQRIPLPARPRPVAPAAAAVPSAAVAEPLAPPAAPTPRIEPVIEIHEELPEALLVLAAGLAFLQLLRLALGYVILRRLKRKAQPAGCPLPVWIPRPVRVLVSGRIAMPMAVGYRDPAILLPQALVERLTPVELRHVLLHETAHLARRDDWITLAERFVRAVFFFQPAVYWIARQIEREREMACDDWVVAQSGQTAPYAGSLARLAELGSQTGSAPVLATGAGRPKQIFARLDALLDQTRNRVPAVSEPLVLIAAALLVLAAVEGAPFNRLLGLTRYTNSWVESSGSFRREMRTSGEIRFTDNDQDVESMSPGARLTLEQSDEWHRRTVDIRTGDQGEILRRYFVDGAERPFDSEARRFLGKTLSQWVREQGHDIPERTNRLLAARGVSGTLDEIRAIRSAPVKRAYLEETFHQTDLNAPELARALRVAGEIESDDEKRHLLDSVTDRYRGQGLDTQLLAFIDTLHSDDARRHLLARQIEEQPAASSVRLLRSVGRLASDSAKADLLQRCARAYTAGLPAEFFEVASGIHSDQDRARSLSAALTFHGGKPETEAHVLQTALTMSSDEGKANLVLAVARRFSGNAASLRGASQLLGSMHSDAERRRGLEAMLDTGASNQALIREMLLQAAALHSDQDKSRVLQKAAPLFAPQDPFRSAFFSAVDTLQSSGERKKVLMAVLERPALDAATLGEVSRSALQIDSETDREAVRKAASDRGGVTAPAR